ncbi:MAG: hypothetical protein ACK40G_11895 [Cytophagaceae bacterium]
MGFLRIFFASIIFLIGFQYSVFGQDLIIKRNGKEIISKISRINGDTIYYFAPPEDTTIQSILQAEVFMIKLKDGTKIVMEEPESLSKEDQAQYLNTAPLNKTSRDSLIRWRGKDLEFMNRRYNIFSIQPTLKSIKSEEVNLHLKNFDKADRIGNFFLYATYPIGAVTTLTYIRLTDYPTYNMSPAQQQEYNTLSLIAFSGLVAVISCQATQLITKQIVRYVEMNKAVKRYNYELYGIEKE